MWKADPSYWGKTSPVLFPFVGFLKNNKYVYKGKEYQGSKHGFARDNEFEVMEHLDDEISFKLSSNDKTLESYPFKFDFIIKYSLENNKLTAWYKIKSKDDNEMYFQIGVHPAFAMLTGNGISYDDYYLEFEKIEKSDIMVMENNLISDKRVKYLKDNNVIKLSRELFDNDALIFDDLKSEEVSLKNTKNNNLLRFSFKEFPYLAFRAVPGADFVCIEPWFGINDKQDSNNILEEKLGIECLGSRGNI